MNPEIGIVIPPGFEPERRYILRVLLDTFLGVPFHVRVDNRQDWELRLPDGILAINDAFFSRMEGEEYRMKSSLPVEPSWYSDTSTGEELPVLYGTPDIRVGQDRVTCGIDLFASAFFMLSRWEETVRPERDEHGRFPAIASTACQWGFLDRPVVNLYAETLWQMLLHLGYKGKRKEKKYRLVPTHDIDNVRYPASLKQFAGDIIKRKSLREFRLRMKYRRDNPYEIYDRLMDLSEKRGVKSRFYFMAGDRHPFDNLYDMNDPLFLEMTRNIIERGHVIGIHPGYKTWKEPDELLRQKERLERAISREVTEGRQHYLRFSVPETWRAWEAVRLKTDLTLGYADREGFRCGTGNAFPVFDVKQRKELKLHEQPLIVMDGTLKNYRNMTAEEGLKRLRFFRAICRKYGMPFTILFHNTIGEPVTWPGWMEAYEEFLRDEN